MSNSRFSKKPEIETVKTAYNQLLRLKRQYKIMENSRKLYEEEIQIQLQKQKIQQNMLQEELINLKGKKKLSIFHTFTVKENQFNEKLVKILRENNTIEIEIDVIQNQIYNLNKKCKTLDDEILRTKQKFKNNGLTLSQLENSDMKISLLESKLSIATENLNKIITKNHCLKNEIQHLIKERSNFKDILDTILEKLQEGKSIILMLIEKATSAYENRDEAQGKFQILKDRNFSIEAIHSHYVRELDRQIYSDIERVKFLTIKGQHRIMKELECKKELKKIMQKKELEDSIKEHQNHLKELQDYFNETNIDNLCSLYFKSEEENYALFNYVNEVNCEVQILQDITKKLRQNKDLEIKRKMSESTKKHANISLLENKLTDIINDYNDVYKVNAELNEKIDIIVFDCKNLFIEAKFDKSPFYKLLGESINDINLSNLDFILKIINNCIVEILKKNCNEIIL